MILLDRGQFDAGYARGILQITRQTEDNRMMWAAQTIFVEADPSWSPTPKVVTFAYRDAIRW